MERDIAKKIASSNIIDVKLKIKFQKIAGGVFWFETCYKIEVN